MHSQENFWFFTFYRFVRILSWNCYWMQVFSFPFSFCTDCLQRCKETRSNQDAHSCPCCRENYSPHQERVANDVADKIRNCSSECPNCNERVTSCLFPIGHYYMLLDILSSVIEISTDIFYSTKLTVQCIVCCFVLTKPSIGMSSMEESILFNYSMFCLYTLLM